MLSLTVSFQIAAGPFAPAAGDNASTAVAADSPVIAAWAQGYENYFPGSYVDQQFQTPEKALHSAGNSDSNNSGYTFDIVSLGRGGSITLLFDPPVRNGEGVDFAVFENSFSDNFLELAWVEVSSNGIDFFRFYNISLTQSAVNSFGNIDPTNVTGLAGKYRRGFGTHAARATRGRGQAHLACGRARRGQQAAALVAVGMGLARCCRPIPRAARHELARGRH